MVAVDAAEESIKGWSCLVAAAAANKEEAKQRVFVLWNAVLNQAPVKYAILVAQPFFYATVAKSLSALEA